MRLSLRVTELSNAQVQVQVCHKLDIQCSDPVLSFEVLDGLAELDVDPWFDGYLQFESPDTLPSLHFLSPPLSEAHWLPNVQLLNATMLTALLEPLGAALGRGRGVAMLTTQDCLGGGSSGVSYAADQADPTTLAFYVNAGLPSSTLRSTGPSGDGGFVNAPAGPLSVIATLGEGLAPVASTSVFVRDGAITYARLAPARATPNPVPSEEASSDN